MNRLPKLPKLKDVFKKYSKWHNIKDLFINPNNVAIVGAAIVLVEIVINIFIIQNVSYTEIDWKAYMQECEGFLNGTLDYSLLRGDTGPLVYPAGFVYIYSIFYFITNRGVNVGLAQYIFLAIYVMQLVASLRIYKRTLKVPPYVLLITILTSYRIHSIYVLRLFNDPIAVLLFFVALNLFVDSKWTLGSVFYSLAVSVKMNILLYAPALLLFYITNLGIKGTIKQLSCCALVQFILGLPFLYGNAFAYLKGSFDLGRVFDHQWTVNYRFLSVEIFENKYFHLILLTLHLMTLTLFFSTIKKYFESFYRLKFVQSKAQAQIDEKNKENEGKRREKRMPNSLKNRRKRLEENKIEAAEESLTSDQQKFLDSFESTIKKSSGNATERRPAPVKEEDPANSVYHINFDRTNQLFILPMFLCNFIGIVFARSLHYQFYSWYFHTLPYLVWCLPISNVFRFLILAVIESSWNTYPSTFLSSLLLHICHVYIIVTLYRSTSQSKKQQQ